MTEFTYTLPNNDVYLPCLSSHPRPQRIVCEASGCSVSRL